MVNKRKSLIDRAYDSFSTSAIGIRILTNQIRGLKPHARFTLINNFVSKGGDLKKLIDINGNSIMFNPNVTNAELSLFKQQGLMDMVNKQGHTLVALESKKLFQNLNKNHIDKNNISKIDFLLKNGSKLDEKIGKNILRLREFYPNSQSIQDLSTSLRKHHPQIVDKYFRENKNSDSLLKAECSLLFTNLNKNQIDLRNLETIENLLKNGAKLDSNFKDSILKLKEYYPSNQNLLTFVDKIESGKIKKDTLEDSSFQKLIKTTIDSNTSNSKSISESLGKFNTEINLDTISTNTEEAANNIRAMIAAENPTQNLDL